MNFHHEPDIDPQGRVKAPTLKEFAKINQVTEDRVWEMIEEGQLSARFINDTILIFRENETSIGYEPSIELEAPMADIAIQSSPQPTEPVSLSPRIGETPDAQKGSVELPLRKPALETELEADEGMRTSHQFDRDEARELLLFAQDSLARTTELSQQLLATKDELLRLKDEKIVFLEKQLQEKNDETRRLRRELENFATLQKIARNPEVLRELLPKDPLRER